MSPFSVPNAYLIFDPGMVIGIGSSKSYVTWTFEDLKEVGCEEDEEDVSLVSRFEKKAFSCSVGGGLGSFACGISIARLDDRALLMRPIILFVRGERKEQKPPCSNCSSVQAKNIQAKNKLRFIRPTFCPWRS